MVWLEENLKCFVHCGKRIQREVENLAKAKGMRLVDMDTGPLPPVLNNEQFLAFIAGENAETIRALKPRDSIPRLDEWMEFHYRQSGWPSHVCPGQCVRYTDLPVDSRLRKMGTEWRALFNCRDFENTMERHISGSGGQVLVMIAALADGSSFPLEHTPQHAQPDSDRTPGQAHGRNAGQAQGSRPRPDPDPLGAKQRPRASLAPAQPPRVATLRQAAPIGAPEIDPGEQGEDAFQCGVLFARHFMDGALPEM